MRSNAIVPLLVLALASLAFPAAARIHQVALVFHLCAVTEQPGKGMRK